MLAMAATPLAARADITSRMTSSVQLQVNAAATSMQRVGNSYSISGNNVDTTDGTIAVVQDDPGESFSFATAFTQGDALHTAGPDVGDVSPFSNQLSTAAGSAGNLAGTVNSQGALTVTAGGAGTSATGQFVTELQIN